MQALTYLDRRPLNASHTVVYYFLCITGTMGRALIELRPSDIRYTQDSIKNTFTFQHEGTLIGETLDDLCNAVCDISDIPLINVSYNDGHYWSADNRRLWVFRQFERLGGCEKITVKEINWNRINPDKFTTENDGIEVSLTLAVNYLR